MTDRPSIAELLDEYATAIAYTDSLWRDMPQEETHWRPVPDSSAIGWHLGHQAAVAHYMVRNLTYAERSPDPGLDSIMDGATEERQRGDLPDLDRIDTYRRNVAERVRVLTGNIDAGKVGAPTQLRRIAEGMLTAIINHEYQHSKWIGEVRSEQFGRALPEVPTSDNLIDLDGYVILR